MLVPVVIFIFFLLLSVGVIMFFLPKKGSPSDPHVDPTSDYKADEGMPISCKDSSSFQTTAKNKLSNLVSKFLKCTTDPDGFSCVRAGEILKVRDAIKIFSFAYFPLRKEYGTITYTKASCDDNQYKESTVTTNDPIEVLLYYASSLYTAIGDYADSKLGKDIELQKCLKETKENLTKYAVQVFSKNISKDLSWQKYFDNPGPYGSTSGGEKVVWAIDKPSDSKSVNKSLLTDPKYTDTRDTGGQFWGHLIPKQDSTTAEAIGQLVKNQVKECKKRYDKMNKTARSGKWSDAIADDSYNIDVFHKFRKSIRTLGRTLETYSFEVPAMSTKIPEDLKSEVKSSFGVDVQGKYYKEALCIGSYDTKKCVPQQILAFLLFVDDRDMFPPKLWGLTETEYNLLRAMVLMYTLKVGLSSVGDDGHYMDKSAVMCPSKTDNYPEEKKGKFTGFDKIDPYMWSPAHIKNNVIYGNFCEIDDVMGDLHDVMVYYQQIFNDPLPGMKEYIQKSSQSLQKFFDQINIDSVMDGISKGVC